MLVTYTGKHFNYNNITKDSICIDDIIHSLAGINRFNGHSSRAYSVAEHTFLCVLMARKLGYSIRQQTLVLIHDFTEAYVGDCPSPLKRLLDKFVELEANVEVAIHEHLNIPMPTEEEYELVKRIDMTMLAIEMRDLTLHQYEEFVVDEVTYKEMLDDKDLKLNPKTGYSRTYLKYVLKNVFEELVVNSREEV